jgi:hypothetical protein
MGQSSSTKQLKKSIDFWTDFEKEKNKTSHRREYRFESLENPII